MIKNSRKRIASRQASALVRRTWNLKQWNAAKSMPGHEDTSPEEFARKIAICETDIANLQAKGVRV
jgi:hypothetical protein